MSWEQPKGKDTLSDLTWWLFWGVIITACVSHPIRWVFFPGLYGKLSGYQELLLFGVTALLIAQFIVRPFCKYTRDEINDDTDNP